MVQHQTESVKVITHLHPWEKKKKDLNLNSQSQSAHVATIICLCSATHLCSEFINACGMLGHMLPTYYVSLLLKCQPSRFCQLWCFLYLFVSYFFCADLCWSIWRTATLAEALTSSVHICTTTICMQTTSIMPAKCSG